MRKRLRKKLRTREAFMTKYLSYISAPICNIRFVVGIKPRDIAKHDTGPNEFYRAFGPNNLVFNIIRYRGRWQMNVTRFGEDVAYWHFIGFFGSLREAKLHVIGRQADYQELIDVRTVMES